MRFRFPIRRRWLQFRLRTLLIAITVFSVWLGYQVNWIHQRQVARKWLDKHRAGVHRYRCGGRFVPPEAPWPLRLLGEKTLHSACVGPEYEELNDLTSYQKAVARIAALFPECDLLDVSESPETLENHKREKEVWHRMETELLSEEQ